MTGSVWGYRRGVRRVAVMAGIVVVATVVAGCGSDGKMVDRIPSSTSSTSSTSTSNAGRVMPISSSAFTDGGTIPTEYTCSGAGMRPPLTWGAPPPGTEELALLVFDPDAGSDGFVHFLNWGIAPSARSATGTGYLGGVPGMNGRGSEGWVPPCPPSGSPHHYEFTVFALARTPQIAATANVRQFLDGIRGDVLASGRVTGLYGR